VVLSTVEEARRELEAAGRLSGYLASCALGLAQRIDETQSVVGFASLVKELRTTMRAALSGVAVPDAVDDLRRRRDAKITLATLRSEGDGLS
jgi:hypothetical protein